MCVCLCVCVCVCVCVCTHTHTHTQVEGEATTLALKPQNLQRLESFSQNSTTASDEKRDVLSDEQGDTALCVRLCSPGNRFFKKKLSDGKRDSALCVRLCSPGILFF